MGGNATWICFWWEDLLLLPSKPLFSTERGQRFISSHLWRCHSEVEAMSECLFSFFMNGIKKGSEKSSIPPQPSILLNHQCLSDSASKSPSQFHLWLIAGLPQGWGAENYWETCENVQLRDLWKRARTHASARDLVIANWESIHYDNVLKQLQGVKNVATVDISHLHIFSMECERYTKINYTKTYGSYFKPNKSNK